MNILLPWPCLYLCVVHVVVGALDAYWLILKIMFLVLDTMVWHVGKYIVLTHHVQEQWRVRVRT